jgi:hypothetical protein
MRFYLRVLADLNEIIRRRKRKVILTIIIEPIYGETTEIWKSFWIGYFM